MIIRNTLIILILTMVHCCAQKESVRYSKSELETIVKKYMNQAYKYNVGSQYYFNEMDKAIQDHPSIAYFWQQYAMPLFKQRKYELGMQYLDKAVALSPEEYLDYRAFIKCIFSKQYREAIQDFEEAVALYGNQHVMDHSYQFYIALCYLQLSEFEKAKNLLEPEIQENIKN